MITNDEQLGQAIERLASMYRALAALRTEVLPVNPRLFALMAEGPVDEIQRIQVQIDAYAGRMKRGGSRPIATRDLTMSIVTIEEAQAKLSELIDKLTLGEEVIIMRNRQMVAELIPLPSAKPQPVFGSCKGMLTIVAEDDEHLEHFKDYMP